MRKKLIKGVISSSKNEYGRRRDCSRHRQSRTVHERFPSHGSSVYGHVSWIPVALCLAILAKSSAVFSSWQCRWYTHLLERSSLPPRAVGML